MPQRRKRTETALQRISRLNPKVDKKLVEESLALIASLRDMGFKKRGYNILDSSESRLKVKTQILSKL